MRANVDRKEWVAMIDNRRLVQILQPFGSLAETAAWEERSMQGEPFLPFLPYLIDGVWTIPVDERTDLRVRDEALSSALSQMLALYVEAMTTAAEAAHPRHSVQQLLAEWQAEEALWDGTVLAQSLQVAGWAKQGAVVVILEPVHRQEEGASQEEAVHLLEEMLAEEAFVLGQGQERVCVLLTAEGFAEQPVSAWLGTLETELYLQYRAAVSAPVEELRQLPHAREEAEFALEAGKLYRGQERIHDAQKLGVARLLHGIPAAIRERFLQEVLPTDVLGSLSAELRETIFAFLEHGQQVADTARALFVHRNTLLYRLERVHELTGYDIRQPIQGWTLWVALMLARSF